MYFLIPLNTVMTLNFQSSGYESLPTNSHLESLLLLYFAMAWCLMSDGVNVYLISAFSRGFCSIFFFISLTVVTQLSVTLYCLLQTTIDLTLHCVHNIIGFFKVFRFYLLLLVENHACYQLI